MVSINFIEIYSECIFSTCYYSLTKNQDYFVNSTSCKYIHSILLSLEITIMWHVITILGQYINWEFTLAILR